MVESRKWLLPLLASLMGFIVAVPVALKSPMYGATATVALLLLIISLLNKVDLPRTLTVVFLPALTAFNMLNNKIGMTITFGLIFLYGIQYLTKKDYRPVRGSWTLLLPVIAWFCYAALQLQWIERTQRSISHIITLGVAVALIWFMSRIFTSAKWFEALYKVWGFVVLCTITIGWWEVTTNNHLPNSGADFYYMKNVATAGFFNPNDFCFYLIISLPVILHWIKGSRVSKLAGLFMLASSFYFMYLGGSRFIVVILLVALCAFLISLAKKRKKLLLFLVATLFIGGVYYYDVIANAVADVASLGSADASVDERHSLSASALRIFQAHPFGVGPGKLESYMPVGITNVHNFWLEILVNYGILVFLTVVSFFAVSLFKIYKATRLEHITLKPILWSAIIFIPASVESSSVFTFNITWFLFGIMICALNIIKRPSA